MARELSANQFPCPMEPTKVDVGTTKVSPRVRYAIKKTQSSGDALPGSIVLKGTEGGADRLVTLHPKDASRSVLPSDDKLQLWVLFITILIGFVVFSSYPLSLVYQGETNGGLPRDFLICLALSIFLAPHLLYCFSNLFLGEQKSFVGKMFGSKTGGYHWSREVKTIVMPYHGNSISATGDMTPGECNNIVRKRGLSQYFLAGSQDISIVESMHTGGEYNCQTMVVHANNARGYVECDHNFDAMLSALSDMEKFSRSTHHDDVRELYDQAEKIAASNYLQIMAMVDGHNH